MVPLVLVVHVGQVVVVRVDELVPLQVGHLHRLAFDLSRQKQRTIDTAYFKTSAARSRHTKRQREMGAQHIERISRYFVTCCNVRVRHLNKTKKRCTCDNGT